MYDCKKHGLVGAECPRCMAVERDQLRDDLAESRRQFREANKTHRAILDNEQALREAATQERDQARQDLDNEKISHTATRSVWETAEGQLAAAYKRIDQLESEIGEF